MAVRVPVTGDKVAYTIARLPARARIFTTSRTISLWGKKEAMAWWLRRKRLGELRDSVAIAYKERFESTENLRPFGLEQLTYFEAPICQDAFGDRNAFEVRPDG